MSPPTWLYNAKCSVLRLCECKLAEKSSASCNYMCGFRSGCNDNSYKNSGQEYEAKKGDKVGIREWT